MNCINPKAVGQNRANFDEISVGASFHARRLVSNHGLINMPFNTLFIRFWSSRDSSNLIGDNHNPCHVDTQLLKKEPARCDVKAQKKQSSA